MITSASSPPLDAHALTSMAHDIALLSDEELIDLAVSWRLRARRGERVAKIRGHFQQSGSMAVSL